MGESTPYYGVDFCRHIKLLASATHDIYILKQICLLVGRLLEFIIYIRYLNIPSICGCLKEGYGFGH
jgi:hypothetical protein